MKKGYLFIVIIFFACKGFTQETVVKKEWLTESVREIYHVLKSDKQTKQGLYQAVYNSKTALASGMYTNNQKTGIWHFYDVQGRLIQNYDYGKNQILYEEPVDSVSRRYVRYMFDTTLKRKDFVTKPIKIGGRCFGFLPYLRLYQLSDDLSDIDPRSFGCMLELLISPGGRLADIKIHLAAPDFNRIITFSPEIVSEEDKQFIPATFNGEAVMTRVFFQCRITEYGTLDVE